MNRTLLRMAKGLWGWIVAITACKMLTLVGLTMFARTLSGFLGDLYNPQLIAGQWQGAVGAALLAAAMMLVGELLVGEAEAACTARARIRLRDAIFAKILQLDVGKVEQIGAVGAIATSTDGVEAMQVYYSKYLPTLLYCAVAPVYLFVQLQRASLPIALLLLIVSLCILPANNAFRQMTEKLKTDYWQSFHGLTGFYLESISALTTLKLFRRDRARTEQLSQRATDFNDKIMGVMKINFQSCLLTESLLYGAVFVAVLIACVQLGRGTMDFATALMVLMLSYSFFASFRQLMSVTHQALTGIAAAQNVSDILDIDASRPVRAAQPRPQAQCYDGIRLSHVGYTYPTGGRGAALADVCIDIPRGKTTALIGRSGSGKSTVASLLLRFCDPDSGTIELQGRPYDSFTPEQLRKQIILVPQSVSLFSGTIADNLRIADPHATQAQMQEALRRVRLWDWVSAQPEGLQHDVGDAGAKLSGGQRQKIGIARALLSGAPYIVLDEATSSVDMESENEIWACIRDLAQTHTLVIISHRLSTIRHADAIYVLQQGRVCEQGTHEQLMRTPGLYRTLVCEQAELEKNAGEVQDA